MSNTVKVREPPEFPRVLPFRRTNQMTQVTLHSHGNAGMTERFVDVPSRLPDIIRVGDHLYVRGGTGYDELYWHEARVWPITKEELTG